MNSCLDYLRTFFLDEPKLFWTAKIKRCAIADIDKAKIKRAMEMTKITNLANKKSMLSGGQRQRVWIAMALRRTRYDFP